MANPPPPYANITGITRTIMKDNQEESIANYDGNARPGEMVVDLTNYNIYIGNTNGNLNLINTGGGSGNSEPAGSVGAVQLNAGGNLFGASANLTFANNTLTVGGITTLNGNTTVAAGRTLKVGSNSVVTTSSREFDPAFIDAAGAFRGATATGNYTLHDNLCYFRINIDFATCTNFGSGQYQVTLPFKSIATMTQRSGTLHQTTGDVRYYIAGIVDLEQHSGNPGETMLLYYSGDATDLAWEVGRPAGATTVTSHFDISGIYQIA